MIKELNHFSSWCLGVDHCKTQVSSKILTCKLVKWQYSFKVTYSHSHFSDCCWPVTFSSRTQSLRSRSCSMARPPWASPPSAWTASSPSPLEWSMSSLSNLTTPQNTSPPCLLTARGLYCNYVGFLIAKTLSSIFSRTYTHIPTLVLALHKKSNCSVVPNYASFEREKC